MFVKAISSNLVDSWGRVVKRTTTFGTYKGYNIAIDNYVHKGGNTLEKRFVVWNDVMQMIVNKCRNSKGKFERVC